MHQAIESRVEGSRFMFLLVVSMFFVAAFAQAAPITLYVAPNGNDAWTGTAAEPNAAGTDGPLATIEGARDMLRGIKAQGKLDAAARVLVREGVYSLSEPIVFTPEDSGTSDAPISYETYADEHPVIDGGRILTGWKQDGDRWVADIPDVRDGRWYFSALWVNGERRTPARTPNASHVAGDEPADEDFFYSAGPVFEKDPKSDKKSQSNIKFHYRPGDLKPWDTLDDAVFVIFHSWETSLLRVKSLDEANRIVEFTGPSPWPFCRWRSDQWYFVENLFEALDQPGEWYLNRKTGRIYYMPMPGEDIAKVKIVAPVAKQLVILSGKPEDGKFVEHLGFKGIRFHYSEYTIEPEGHRDGQAAASIPAAFEAVGARHCVIENCEVGHVGTYGVWFRRGCQDNRLVHSEVFDLGAGGVRIGESGSPATEPEAALRNVIDNCFLHDGGRIFRGAVGVWVGRSSYNTISHNEVCDFRYSGLSIGWSWGYAESSAHHNIIEYNHVHHVGHGQLSDMGVIYTLGVSPGTVIRNNLFHDSMSNPKVSGGWGIYFDEGSTDILAENNVVYNTLTGTLHQHYGKENRVRNNIFAFSHREQLIRSREEDHISFFFENNIVYFNNGRLLGSTWRNGNFRLDDNCYWDVSGDDIEFGGRTFAEWQAQGQDAHSIIADPLFVDPEHGDFTLKPDSPALALGFKPIDLSEVGLYGESEWVEKPRRIPRPPFTPPAIPKPATIKDDFESANVDSLAAGASTLGEEGAARIRVTDETAASGKHSLKFTDAPGLDKAFNPHLVYAPNLHKGLAVGAFAIRVEPGEVMFHEWRDSKSPYRVGPSLWISGEGDLAVGGNTLMKIPLSEWIHIHIECKLGKKADGVWALTVTLPGQEPKGFEKLACGTKEFSHLDWYGFVSNATDAAVMYLDTIDLATK